ncbi:cytochrome c [Chlorobium phaeovibrioides]|uniref:Cytochrome c n=2 Tax=Chlorobium phaeovibrioides TaxID=1094 RepID=A0A5M8IEX8_CHLPH|nr:c-type cytochrome [Chlorobium phaeovibrioides]KAA6232985.1 cytochrome c [Chlorobium phaeovibrioides]HCD36140.1 cytochrome C [Chlorobium sp.]
MKPLTILLVGSALLAPAHESAQAADSGSTGRELYRRHCSSCHSMTPPPETAPPIVGLAHFYHKAFDSREAGVSHIMDFIAHPEPAKSKLRAPAIPRFGLMPQVELTKEELRTVSEWLWDSYDQAFVPPDCPE